MWTCPKCGEMNRDPGRCVQCNAAQPGSMFASMDALDEGIARNQEITDEIESSQSDEDRKVWNETGKAKPSKAGRLLRDAGLAPRKGGYRENAIPDDDDEDENDDGVGEVEEPESRSRRPSILQMALLAIVLILVVMSAIGFSRWTGPTTAFAAPVTSSPLATATDESPATPATASAITLEPKATSTASSTVPPVRPSATAPAVAKTAKSGPACDTGCAKVTLPDGTPTWVGGNGGGGLPCCGELAEKAKAASNAKCDPTCMYNGRCQILRSASGGSGECCKPIRDEFGCAK